VGELALARQCDRLRCGFVITDKTEFPEAAGGNPAAFLFAHAAQASSL
jgi:hypothetical protein